MDNQQQLVKSTLRHGFLLLFGVAMIYPVLWLLSSALKSNEELPHPNLIPKTIMWENFYNGWNAIPGYSFAHFFTNSLFITVVSVLGTVISSAFVAYGFARINFPLKSLWFAILMLTLMLPTQVTLVPQYILFKTFGWVGSTLPLIVPHFLAVSPFFVFLMVQFIRGIPKDLDESAKIDGCSYLGTAVRIIFPLCKPAFITAAIFSFIWTWDDFLAQIIYLTDTELYTVPLALRLFLDTTSEMTWGPMYAMAVLSILPSFLIFLSAQKYFVEGVSTTGLKG